MTAVSHEAHAVPQTDAPRSRSLVQRLAILLGRLRQEDLRVTMARAVEEAFRAIARDFRN